MKKKNCKQYAKKYLGYPYNDEFCKGNNYVYQYKEQPLCEDIGCEDQKEGRCTTTEEYEKNTNESKIYPYSGPFSEVAPELPGSFSYFPAENG